MDEQTITEDNLFDASDFDLSAESQDTEQAQQADDSSAVEETKEQTASEETNSETQAEQDVPQEETQGDVNITDDFLAKKGINRNDPDAFDKVIKMAANAEKAMNKKSQEKAQLERRLAESRVIENQPGDEALSQVRQMRKEMEVERWKQAKGLDAETESKMTAFLAEPLVDQTTGQPIIDTVSGQPLTKGLLVLNGALSLDNVYDMVGGGANKTKIADLKASLKQEVKREMDARQNAVRPSAQSTDSTQFKAKEGYDPFLDGLGF